MPESLVENFRKRLAEQDKRCNLCDLSHKIDSPAPRKGWIRSRCGRCGAWLGDRPAERGEKGSEEPGTKLVVTKLMAPIYLTHQESTHDET